MPQLEFSSKMEFDYFRHQFMGGPLKGILRSDWVEMRQTGQQKSDVQMLIQYTLALGGGLVAVWTLSLPEPSLAAPKANPLRSCLVWGSRLKRPLEPR